MRAREPSGQEALFALRLTAAERGLLVGDCFCLPSRVVQTVKHTLPDKPVRLTLDDWDNISGWVAGEANHTSDRKLERTLDRLFVKIEALRGRY